MLIRIFAMFWIITGIFFFVFPDFFRRQLQKKGYRRLRNNLFFLIIFIAGFLIGIAWKTHGLWSKVVLVFALIALTQAFFFLKAKAAEKIFDWCGRQPILFYRQVAAGQILLGLVILQFYRI